MTQRSSMKWDTAAAERAIRAATARGLAIWAEHVLNESNAIVPLDEATLQRSGVASVDPRELEAAVSYDTPYAVRQHEDETIVHRNGRQAKYLERAWLASRPLAGKIIANQIRKATRS